MNNRIKLQLSALVSVVSLSVSPVIFSQDSKLETGTGSDWPYAGHSIYNYHSTDTGSNVNRETISSLTPKWVYKLDTMSGVSATPAVVNGVVYFPDWGGNLQAVNASTGKVIWKKNFKNDYSRPGKSITLSRVTPAYNNGVLYVGNNNNFGAPPADGAVMLAIDANTGNLIWSKVVDTTSPYSVITQSPIVYNGIVYVGTSSLEEATGCALSNTCHFRGSLVALNAKTGEIKWQTYMTTPGFSGASVWGGQPVPDLKRNSIYVATGNNYTTPADIKDAPSNMIESIVALDMDTGAIKWSTKLTLNGQPDIWTMVCFLYPSADCGPDFDFGQAPMLIKIKASTKGEVADKGEAADKGEVADKGEAADILVNGQKSGMFYGLNPDNGQLIWSTLVGPGSALGGAEWGSATDGKYIYTTITNYYGISYKLIKPAPNSMPNTTGGFWSALDPANGQIVWQSADPDMNLVYAGVTVSNGILYGGTVSGNGSKAGAFVGLDSKTGEIIWNYSSGIDSAHTGGVVGSPAIVKGVLYWGAGFPRIFTNAASNLFYAFSIDGKR